MSSNHCELELELIQSHMTQNPVLRGVVVARGLRELSQILKGVLSSYSRAGLRVRKRTKFECAFPFPPLNSGSELELELILSRMP